MMISIILRRKRSEQPFQGLLFRRICDSTMIMMALDVIFRFTDGGSSRMAIDAVTWLYFLFEPVPLLFWLCYLDYYLHKSAERLKKRLYYSPLFFIIFLLMALNPFFHWVYSIDGDNFYQRGPLVPVIVYLNIIILVVTIIMAARRKRDVGQGVFLSLVMFGIIPLSGNLLQFLLDGTVILWPSVAVAVVFIYLFLESQRDLKDFLTGMLNRQQINDIINNRLAALEKSGGFTLVMIDLDDFKSINDNHGHKEGDRALIKAAELIHSSVRSIDKVARFGGDEFIILLEEEDRREVEKVVSRIDAQIYDYNTGSQLPYRLSLSCGYKTIQRGEKSSFYDLIHAADLEMYRVKRGKKGLPLFPDLV